MESKLYKVVAYIRIDGEPDDYEYYRNAEDAKGELLHCNLMQPENIYKIEEVTPEDEDWPNNPEIVSYTIDHRRVSIKDIGGE
ncbi:MAG: hypothetical protein MK009_05960 [Gammaproteobacteria bacterium]|nr:hypothetical protein [Gammaproteobacteria bacterium]